MTCPEPQCGCEIRPGHGITTKQIRSSGYFIEFSPQIVSGVTSSPGVIALPDDVYTTFSELPIPVDSGDPPVSPAAPITAQLPALDDRHYAIISVMVNSIIAGIVIVQYDDIHGTQRAATLRVTSDATSTFWKMVTVLPGDEPFVVTVFPQMPCEIDLQLIGV